MKISFVAWRNGRPRFNPSENLRRQGHVGHDLKNADGSWMTKGQALDWSDNFTRKIQAEKAAIKASRQAERAREEKAAARAMREIAKLRPRAYSLGQLLEEWSQKGAEIDRAAGTVRVYRTMINIIRQDHPMLWASDANALNRPTCQLLYDALRRERGINQSLLAMKMLSVAVNWAIDRGKTSTLSINPVVKLRMTRPKPRVRMINVAQYFAILRAAERLSLPVVADLLVWGLFTAQRPGDRLASDYANIVEGRYEITQQKTGAFVSIPLARPIRDRLPAPDRRKGLIFPREQGGALTADAYRRRWKAVIAEAMAEFPELEGLNDQDLRDTAITWLGLADCTPVQIFAITGHAFEGNTSILRHYMNPDPDIANTAIAKLEAWFEREVEKMKGHRNEQA